MPKNLRFIFRLIALAAILGVVPQTIFAVPLAEYRENISHLREDLVKIIYPDEDSTAAENDKFRREVFKEFPELLPARDQIESGKTTVEVSNQWIYDALGRFEKEAAKPDAQRLILMEVHERLSALENELNRLETATAGDRTKDENKQKLSEILRRAEYQKPEEKPKSLFERIYEKIMKWLDNSTPKDAEPKPLPDANDFSSLAFVLQMLLYALILGIIGFLIYRLAPFFMKKYRSREKSEKTERVILGERIAADETAQNLFSEAEKLAMAGNLRGAIRKGYIAFLCELSDKKIIGLSQHKTNRDYLRDVRKRADLHSDLLGLTNNYERHWYGFEAAQADDWEEFRNAYRRAVNNSR